MDDLFDWFEKLFSPESYSKKLFSGSETHAIIIFNDDINSMNYVTNKLVSILNIPEAKALELMFRIDNEGIAVVWTGNGSEAEQYLSSLRDAGLKSCVTLVPE